MKKIGLIIIVIMAIVGTLLGITCGGCSKEKDSVMVEITSESKAIKYKNDIYQVIPSDMIEEQKEYADILDGLKLGYKVDVNDLGVKIKNLEEGASLYMTKYQDDRVFIVKDNNAGYEYAFKLQ